MWASWPRVRASGTALSRSLLLQHEKCRVRKIGTLGKNFSGNKWVSPPKVLRWNRLKNWKKKCQFCHYFEYDKAVRNFVLFGFFKDLFCSAEHIEDSISRELIRVFFVNEGGIFFVITHWMYLVSKWRKKKLKTTVKYPLTKKPFFQLNFRKVRISSLFLQQILLKRHCCWYLYSNT